MRTLPGVVSPEIQARFSRIGNTLQRIVADRKEDRISLEIGDIHSPDFLPQAKIMRWDNEVNFSLRWKNNSPNEPLTNTRTNRVEYKVGKQTFRAYELDPSELGEDGGIEIELQLDEKPESNVFEFTLETKGLRFSYQPPLTQQEISDNKIRPENVVGSYAAYHETKSNNTVGGKHYRAGKAFHIYRPKIKDKNGNWTWGELNLDSEKKLLTVTVDESFLAGAVYPVIVDPTFGYTSIGGSSGYWDTGTIGSDGVWWRPNTNGTLDSLSMYGASYGASCNLGLGIYNTSTNNLVDSNTASINNTAAWKTISMNNAVIGHGSAYFLCHHPGDWIVRYWDTGNGGWAGKQKSQAYPTFPNPITWSTIGAYDWFSIYATYTAVINPHKNLLLTGVG